MGSRVLMWAPYLAIHILFPYISLCWVFTRKEAESGREKVVLNKQII